MVTRRSCGSADDWMRFQASRPRSTLNSMFDWPEQSQTSPTRRSDAAAPSPASSATRSEEHTSELQSLMRISYAVFCLKKKKKKHQVRCSMRTKTKTKLKHTQNIAAHHLV